MKKEVLFLALLPFSSVVLAKRQPCRFACYSPARVCVTEQAGTNNIGLFKPGGTATWILSGTVTGIRPSSCRSSHRKLACQWL
ncbi:hypothetical protein DM02DRAFT_282202 [Periconia macrospinosa]|uniref:Uncharacterized protein n=1 Tax=Periconia macrospinosa TaxID=97972 RepID=A0A2V1D2V2_9PLEO|nr:hypothetical protein DM02DRAFT_282202 [Periconia macrospinosa]